jgi:hypothetical protein
MDCRAFHQKLEDYLENGMDFSGRFGMERHARHCIGCGKVMADAQHLRQMASELHRVKAPANFESSVLKEIAIRKAHGRLWSVRRYWIHGFEWPSWRKVAFASSSLAILSIAIFYASHRATFEPVSAPPRIAFESAKIAVEVKEVKDRPDNKVAALLSKEPVTAETRKPAIKAQSSRKAVEPERLVNQGAQEMDYVEYTIRGSDNHAVPVRLPKRIPLRYNQMSEEYFILNVSH